jgi:membrane protease subunit (stomatin/prohibitin family)
MQLSDAVRGWGENTSTSGGVWTTVVGVKEGLVGAAVMSAAPFTCGQGGWRQRWGAQAGVRRRPAAARCRRAKGGPLGRSGCRC